MLRAILRASSETSPVGSSNGTTVSTSAPPTPAPKAATVARSRFTWTSKALVIGRLVTAWIRVRGSGTSHSSAIRAQRRRAARSFAIVANCSSVAASRSSTRPKPCSAGMPAASSVRSTAAPRASSQPSSWPSEAPSSCTVVASTTTARTPACSPSRAKAASSVVVGGTQVAVGVQRAERDQGLGLLEGRRLEHDRREVEPDAVERRGEVGPDLVGEQPEAAGAGLQVAHGGRAVPGRPGADVPAARARGPPRRGEVVEQVRRAERRDRDAVVRRAGRAPTTRRRRDRRHGGDGTSAARRLPPSPSRPGTSRPRERPAAASRARAAGPAAHRAHRRPQRPRRPSCPQGRSAATARATRWDVRHPGRDQRPYGVRRQASVRLSRSLSRNPILLPSHTSGS